MKGTSALVTKRLEPTIQVHWATDRILKIVTRLTMAVKLAQAARFEVPAAYTGPATIIINEEESTLASNMQIKSRAIATEPAIIKTQEGHPTSCNHNINTTNKCHARLAKANQSP